MDDSQPVRLRLRTSPGGAVRIAWSYVAALAATAVAGLGLTLAGYAGDAACAADDVSCALALYLVFGIVGGVLASALWGWLFRLGWEWWLLCSVALLALPAALDLMGSGAWVALALAPGAAALATWSGPGRAAWRPAVIAVVCAAIATWSVMATFFPPGA